MEKVLIAFLLCLPVIASIWLLHFPSLVMKMDGEKNSTIPFVRGKFMPKDCG
jgi:hypothetical protein